MIEFNSERFWSFVTKQTDISSPHVTTPCWVYGGCRDKDGYGQLTSKLDGNKRPVAAHRISWQIHFGEIPKDMHVLHRCDNPPCMNPGHLFLGTVFENVQDMDAKGRRRWNVEHAKKLTEEQVLEIRSAPLYRGIQKYLRNKFHVSDGVISEVISRKMWIGVEPTPEDRKRFTFPANPADAKKEERNRRASIVKSRRVALGLPQQQMSDLMGIRNSYLSQMENAKCWITDEQFEKAIAILDSQNHH